MKVISLFSGAGGLDLGFQQSGFEILWANEFDRTIWDTHQNNFPDVELCKKSIAEVDEVTEIPDGAVGIIGGPPCQSWSEAGARRGINDPRGKLFFDYVRVLKTKKPLFFLAENVPGILHKNNKKSFENIIKSFNEIGYNISYKVINASDYNVPQDRKRVIIVGVLKTTGKYFQFPERYPERKTLRDSIFDLRESPQPADDRNYHNSNLVIPNHEFMVGDFSSMYMSRNRVRGWDEPSFTIQAGGRHAPLHPQAPKMIKVEEDKFIFNPRFKELYRRLTVRECARIQTFPDDFIFSYNQINNGYKMVGNAVPVNLSLSIALAIRDQLF